MHAHLERFNCYGKYVDAAMEVTRTQSTVLVAVRSGGVHARI